MAKMYTFVMSIIWSVAALLFLFLVLSDAQISGQDVRGMGAINVNLNLKNRLKKGQKYIKQQRARMNISKVPEKRMHPYDKPGAVNNSKRSFTISKVFKYKMLY